MASDLGPMPAPKVDPGEPNPGGVDAIDDDSGPILIPDLTAEENPAIEDAPDPLKEQVEGSEDTSTTATRSEGGDHEGADEDKESPA